MTAEAALRLNRMQAMECNQAGYRLIRLTQPDKAGERILRAPHARSIPALLSAERIEGSAPSV